MEGDDPRLRQDVGRQRKITVRLGRDAAQRVSRHVVCPDLARAGTTDQRHRRTVLLRTTTGAAERALRASVLRDHDEEGLQGIEHPDPPIVRQVHVDDPRESIGRSEPVNVVRLHHDRRVPLARRLRRCAPAEETEYRRAELPPSCAAAISHSGELHVTDTSPLSGIRRLNSLNGLTTRFDECDAANGTGSP